MDQNNVKEELVCGKGLAKIVNSMYYYVDLQNIFYLKKYSLNYYPI